jgi:hypothetical protein
MIVRQVVKAKMIGLTVTKYKALSDAFSIIAESLVCGDLAPAESRSASNAGNA